MSTLNVLFAYKSILHKAWLMNLVSNGRVNQQISSQKSSFDDSHPNRYTVASLNKAAKSLLEGQFPEIIVEGEISNLARPASGHQYFSLKDKDAQVRAAFFKQSQRNSSLQLDNGQKVLVKCRLSLYAPRGDYQIIVSQVELAGHGALQQAFEALKAKLAAEGLFAETLKKPIPQIPRTIGIVTSESGAALKDILHVLARRFPVAKIYIYPTMVQGSEATQTIVHAIQTANNTPQVDVLIVGRGGGSLEDLWCFNEEAVARAISASNIPIISAVGHQTDFTIADFVADLRAPTPSAAAELATPDTQALSQLFAQSLQQLKRRIEIILQQHTANLHALARHIKHPKAQLEHYYQKLDDLASRLTRAQTLQFHACQQQVNALSQSLKMHNPRLKIQHFAPKIDELERRMINAFSNQQTNRRQAVEHLFRLLTSMGYPQTLKRGFTLTFDEHKNLMTSAQTAAQKQSLTLQFHDGELLVLHPVITHT